MEFQNLLYKPETKEAPADNQAEGLNKKRVKDPMIVPLIDTYTAVWHESSIGFVMEYYGLSDMIDQYCLQADFSTMMQMSTEKWFISFQGIQFDFKTSDLPTFHADSELADFMSACISDLRVNFTGKGLEYMRFCGMDVNGILRKPLPAQAHVTRCDFAFDFVNYKPEFLDQCIDHCMNFARQGLKRIPLCKVNGGTSYSFKLGDQKTLYLGSPASDSVLRMYDKRMQFSKLGVLTDCPYGTDSEIQSWIRIEWQTRNKRASGLLFGCVVVDGQRVDFWDSLLKTLYLRYRFRDPDIEYHKCVPMAFWEELFDFDEIPGLLCKNSYFVQLGSMVEKEERYLKAVVLPFLSVFVRRRGLSSLIRELAEYYEMLRCPQTDRQRMAQIKYLRRLNDLCDGDLSKLEIPIDTIIDCDYLKSH